MKTQREFIEQIDSLIKASPHLEVRFMVASDEVSEDHKHTAHLIERVEIDVYHEGDDGYFIGEIEVSDYFGSAFSCIRGDSSEIREAVENKLSNSKQGIFIYTGAL